VSVDGRVVAEASVAARRHAPATPARENDSQAAHRRRHQENRGLSFAALSAMYYAPCPGGKAFWNSTIRPSICLSNGAAA